MKKELVLVNEINEIKKLPLFLDEITEELSLSTEMMFNLNLVLEEMVVNIMMYAYKEKGKEIHLTIEVQEDWFVVTLIDWGERFDPTQLKDPDVMLSAEERPIGGLGIFLVRNLMDEMTYRRENEMNVFIMKKRLEK